MTATTIGIDLAKSVFQLHGVDEAGDVVFRKKLRRGAVLDFLMMDDAWVVAFCDEVAVPYDRLMQARAALPGGEQVNWT